MYGSVIYQLTESASHQHTYRRRHLRSGAAWAVHPGPVFDLLQANKTEPTKVAQKALGWLSPRPVTPDGLVSRR